MSATDWSDLTTDPEVLRGFGAGMTPEQLSQAIDNLPEHDVDAIVHQLGLRTAAATRRKAIVDTLLTAMGIAKRILLPAS